MVGSTKNPADMVLQETIHLRTSVRAFLSRSVDRPLLERMFAVAQRAPSWGNVQPWRTYLLSDHAVQDLSTRLLNSQREPRAYDIQPPERFEEPFRARRRESGLALYASLGIRKEHTERRQAQSAENYRFFGAPHVAIVTSSRLLGSYAFVDTGVYLSHLMLAAKSLGVGSITQASVAGKSDIVRQALGIPDEEAVIAAVSLGYPDNDHPVNALRTSRAPMAEVVTFIGELNPEFRSD